MKKKERRGVSALAAMLLLCVFAVSALAVLTGGAGAYNRLTERDSRSYEKRTSAQYISAKLRQCPEPREAEITRFGDGAALVLPEKGYNTLIYCSGGWLMELYCDRDLQLEPDAGEKILPLDGMELSLCDGLLRVQLREPWGEELSCVISLYPEGGAA